MRKHIILILLVIAGNVYGADSLHVDLNTRVLKQGDTLEFKCTVANFAKLKLQRATLNVWIDDVLTHKRWKFRYPMINGECSAALTLGDKIPDGHYAVNFLVQPGFFRISGEIQQHNRHDTGINYMMFFKNKKGAYFDRVHVEKDGNFRLKSTLFEDSAYFIFTPNIKVNNNYLVIDIETPLDSAFVPVLQKTHFITVGNKQMAAAGKTDTSSYVFSDVEVDQGTLPGVTVKTKLKTKVQQFDEEYSNGLFDNPEALIFDGIESTQIERSIDIFHFLMGRIAGLDVDVLGNASWRGHGVEFFVDEFPFEARDIFFVSPLDVAMIKVYRPPSHISGNFSNQGGSIAIYTKRGAYLTKRNSRHNFIVRGYNRLEDRWEL
ncbi:MAG: hypothetical protein V4539_18370 [Bacteroidota bacterium]